MPTVVSARVIALRTQDGLVEFEDASALGRVYQVDLDTIVREAQMLNLATPITAHVKDIVCTVDGGWLPLECLQLLLH